MDDLAILLRAGAAQSEIRYLDNGAPFLLVPNDYKVQSLETLLNQPLERRGELEFYDVKSFIEFTKLFKQPNSLAMWYKREGNGYKFVLIFDFHEKGMPTVVDGEGKGEEAQAQMNSQAHKWQFQIFMIFKKKAELDRLLKAIKEVPELPVVNAYAHQGPYPVTQPPPKDD